MYNQSSICNNECMTHQCAFKFLEEIIIIYAISGTVHMFVKYSVENAVEITRTLPV